MKYHELFEIQIGHQYFSTGEFVELVIVPVPETYQLLKGQHFLIKNKLNGLRVVAETEEYNPVIFLNKKLTFEVFPTSGTFHLCTDVSELAPGEFWTFSNTATKRNDQLTATITSDKSKSLNGYQRVARIEIYPTDEVLDHTTTTLYTVPFHAIAAIWKYYLITNPLPQDLVIEDKGSPALKFNKKELEDETADAVMSALRESYPAAGLVLFESNLPVPRKSTGRKDIQLVQDDQVIIQHLPNPAAKNQEIEIIKIVK